MEKEKRYKINEVKLPYEVALLTRKELEKRLAAEIEKKLKKKNLKVKSVEILRESIDSRKKPNIYLVYSLAFTAEYKNGKSLSIGSLKGLEVYEQKRFNISRIERETQEDDRPVVVGFGPCGMFAALTLARSGLRPIVVERGEAIEDRIKTVDRFWKEGKLDTNSNVQFGEGGAGTFSDGKLNTGTKDPRIRQILEDIVGFGGPRDILYKQKPHIGTDRLRKVVVNLRKEVLALGGEIHFRTKFAGFNKDGGSYIVKLEKGDGLQVEIKCHNLVLAIGHSARDTFYVLKDEKLDMEQKPFSIGVRVEHPQSLIDKAQYGDEEIGKILGAASYKLSHKCKNGRGVYSFCMCPGGEIVMAASEDFMTVTNGMSYRKRDSGKANSGILVDVRTSDFGDADPLAGVEFQRRYESLAWKNGQGHYKGPECRFKDFKEATDATGKVMESLPDFAVESIREGMVAFGKKIEGFDGDDVRLVATETRSSSPVRILRDGQSLESISFPGIYPAGEGCGYAGGITSAAVDGIKIAEKIVEKYVGR